VPIRPLSHPSRVDKLNEIVGRKDIRTGYHFGHGDLAE